MRLAILFLILLFLVNFLFIVSDWDYQNWGFSVDPYLHFFGGFFVAMFFIDYFRNLKIGNPGTPKLKLILIIVSTVVFVGVMWEIAEYIATAAFGDYLYETYSIVCCMGDLDDTINDLAMDILGAGVFTLITLKSIYKK